ncbi:MAG: hypothetical protein ARM1_0535 [Candidatus Micrarchaeota archaeon]|nr:MAG: hypothetical protein ARM1_0535 [Candidatus Micrarchaeota archaeon]
MAFIDFLTLDLFSLSFAGFIILYTSTKAFLSYRAMIKKARQILDYEDLLNDITSASLPLFSIGIIMFITSLYGVLTWPLPGSYNILFFEPLLMASVLVISVGFALYKRLTLQLDYMGFFALLSGLMAIYYGLQGYSIGLTEEPLIMMLMYLFFGLAGVFTFPYMYEIKRIASNKTKKVHPLVNFVIVLFWIFTLLGALTAMITGLAALPSHLARAP